MRRSRRLTAKRRPEPKRAVPRRARRLMPAPVRASAPGLPTVWATMPPEVDDAGVADRLVVAAAVDGAALALLRTAGEAAVAFVVAEALPVDDEAAAEPDAAGPLTSPSAHSDSPPR